MAELVNHTAGTSRGVPDFLVIGAAKCGTTSLRNYLDQHPQLFLPERGEPSFFAHVDSTCEFHGPGDNEWTFITDLDEYEALFATAASDQLTGEISPRYLYFEQSAAAISRIAPAAKLAAVLRHPVDRAYSHFTMNRVRGCEPEESFSSALRLSSQRWDQGWGWDWMYVEAGQYASQVRRYQNQFDKSQLAFFIYEEWVADTDEFYSDLFTFLGVDPSFRPDTEHRERKAAMPRSSTLAGLLRKGHGAADALRIVTPPFVRQIARRAVESVNVKEPERLDPGLRSDLYDEFFSADVAELERLLGRTIAAWSPSHAS